VPVLWREHGDIGELSAGLRCHGDGPKLAWGDHASGESLGPMSPHLGLNALYDLRCVHHEPVVRLEGLDGRPCMVVGMVVGMVGMVRGGMGGPP